MGFGTMGQYNYSTPDGRERAARSYFAEELGQGVSPAMIDLYMRRTDMQRLFARVRADPTWRRYDDPGRDRSAPSITGNVTPKRDRPKCEARTRSGGQCRAPAAWDKMLDRPRNGRCRLHGGLSTGPKTDEGKRRVTENLKKSAPTAVI